MDFRKSSLESVGINMFWNSTRVFIIETIWKGRGLVGKIDSGGNLFYCHLNP